MVTALYLCKGATAPTAGQAPTILFGDKPLQLQAPIGSEQFFDGTWTNPDSDGIVAIRLFDPEGNAVTGFSLTPTGSGTGSGTWAGNSDSAAHVNWHGRTITVEIEDTAGNKGYDSVEVTYGWNDPLLLSPDHPSHSNTASAWSWATAAGSIAPPALQTGAALGFDLSGQYDRGLAITQEYRLRHTATATTPNSVQAHFQVILPDATSSVKIETWVDGVQIDDDVIDGPLLPSDLSSPDEFTISGSGVNRAEGQVVEYRISQVGTGTPPVLSMTDVDEFVTSNAPTKTWITTAAELRNWIEGGGSSTLCIESTEIDASDAYSATDIIPMARQGIWRFRDAGSQILHSGMHASNAQTPAMDIRAPIVMESLSPGGGFKTNTPSTAYCWLRVRADDGETVGGILLQGINISGVDRSGTGYGLLLDTTVGSNTTGVIDDVVLRQCSGSGNRHTVSTAGGSTGASTIRNFTVEDGTFSSASGTPLDTHLSAVGSENITFRRNNITLLPGAPIDSADGITMQTHYRVYIIDNVINMNNGGRHPILLQHINPHSPELRVVAEITGNEIHNAGNSTNGAVRPIYCQVNQRNDLVIDITIGPGNEVITPNSTVNSDYLYALLPDRTITETATPIPTQSLIYPTGGGASTANAETATANMVELASVNLTALSGADAQFSGISHNGNGEAGIDTVAGTLWYRSGIEDGPVTVNYTATEPTKTPTSSTVTVTLTDTMTLAQIKTQYTPDIAILRARSANFSTRALEPYDSQSTVLSMYQLWQATGDQFYWDELRIFVDACIAETNLTLTAETTFNGSLSGQPRSQWGASGTYEVWSANGGNQSPNMKENQLWWSAVSLALHDAITSKGAGASLSAAERTWAEGIHDWGTKNILERWRTTNGDFGVLIQTAARSARDKWRKTNTEHRPGFWTLSIGTPIACHLIDDAIRTARSMPEPSWYTASKSWWLSNDIANAIMYSDNPGLGTFGPWAGPIEMATWWMNSVVVNAKGEGQWDIDNLNVPTGPFNFPNERPSPGFVHGYRPYSFLAFVVRWLGIPDPNGNTYLALTKNFEANVVLRGGTYTTPDGLHAGEIADEIQAYNYIDGPRSYTADTDYGFRLTPSSASYKAEGSQSNVGMEAITYPVPLGHGHAPAIDALAKMWRLAGENYPSSGKERTGWRSRHARNLQANFPWGDIGLCASMLSAINVTL